LGEGPPIAIFGTRWIFIFRWRLGKTVSVELVKRRRGGRPSSNSEAFLDSRKNVATNAESISSRILSGIFGTRSE